jgi:hypothetical protein
MFSLLSTECFDAAPVTGWQDKQMVYTTEFKRDVIDLILRECKIESDAELARLCQQSGQNLGNWWKRPGRWPAAAWELLPAVTGISADYMGGKKVPPFPDGPKVAAVVDPTVVGLVNDVLVLRAFLLGTFRAMAANERDEALAVASYYRTAMPGKVWQDHEFAGLALGILDAAAEEAATSSPPGGRRAAGVKSKHPPRSRKHS